MQIQASNFPDGVFSRAIVVQLASNFPPGKIYHASDTVNGQQAAGDIDLLDQVANKWRPSSDRARPTTIQRNRERYG